MQKTSKVKAPATPYSHTQVETTDMAVSTTFIATEEGAEVA